jgi:chloramphenicol-sensitive protein RarD
VTDLRLNRGFYFALGAYFLWGTLPIYWKWLHVVPAQQIIAHRIVWSFVFLVIVISARKEWPALRAAVRSRRTLLIFTAAALLLGVNWYTYIWAVNAGRVVETSLGYFINPLVSVLLGVLFLKERLRWTQWAVVGLASCGVLYLTLHYGQLPWIALLLAVTFGLYGLVKKTAPLGSLHGLMIETTILVIPSLMFLLLVENQGSGALGHSSLNINLLLIFTGVVTAFPMLLFGMAARLIPLSTMGFIQYVSPTCQFILGVFVFNEAFSLEQLIGFMMIWGALILFTCEGAFARRRVALVLGD